MGLKGFVVVVVVVVCGGGGGCCGEEGHGANLLIFNRQRFECLYVQGFQLLYYLDFCC